MGIVIKLLIKNIFSKKARTFLILFSIIMSAAVLFSSISISGSILKTVMNAVTKVVGASDITILPTETSLRKVVDKSLLEKYSDRFEFVIGELDKKAMTVTPSRAQMNINLKGIDLEELDKLNPYILKSSANLEPFENKKIIIGEDFARENNYKLGDTIRIYMGSEVHRFSICGIASASRGVFSKAITVKNFVIPKATLETMLDMHDKENMVFIKLKDASAKKQMVSLLEKEYPAYEVKQTFNTASLEAQLSDISLMFMVLSGIVFFMSVFIIYSSFKIIAAERIPMIGTLRSVGATKKRTNIILLGESLVYGTLGGILGGLAGIGVLYLLSMYMSDIANVAQGVELNTVIEYSPLQMAATFAASVILSLISSIVPIVKTSKIPIKDIILRVVQVRPKSKYIRIALGIVFMIIAYIITIPEYSPDDNIFLGLAMLFVLLSIVLFIPYIVAFFVKIFERIYVVIFGNVGTLAAKNLRENNSVINNIVMLSIGIAVLLAINTSGYNTVLSTLNSFQDARYDLRVTVTAPDRDFKIRLANTDGVKEVYADYEFDNIKIVNTDKLIGTIKGVDIDKFNDFWSIQAEVDSKALIRQLDDGRNIMISSTMQKSLGIKKGDMLRLKMESGEKAYKVIGTFKDFMNDSDYALISHRYIKRDMQEGESSVYYVKTGKEPKYVFDQLTSNFKSISPKIASKNKLRQIEIDDNKSTIALMQSFCIMAIVIGFFGVINNLILSFIQRKQSLAMFRSVGMSKKQTVKMIFIEALTGGIIGSISGILGGMAMIYIFTKFDNSMFNFDIQSIWTYVLAGIIIMLAASIGPLIKSTKINLIDSLKYE